MSKTGQFTDYKRTYTSIAGVDITPVIGGKVIGTLQQITVMVNRDKAPWWALGRVNARGIARGKRSIAGTLNFLDINQHALLSIMDAKYCGYIHEHHPSEEERASDALSGIMLSGLPNAPSVDKNRMEGDQANFNMESIPTVGFNKDWLPATHADQLPPFDIVLSATNEMGVRARMVVFGVEILNDGIGVSINDLVMEQQLQFVAMDMIPWRSLGYLEPKGQ